MFALGPRYCLPGSFLFRMQADPAGYLLRLHRRYGDVVRIDNGRTQALLVVEPELIRELLVNQAHRFQKGRGLRMSRSVLGDGLLSSEGDCHRRHRKLMQPGFQRQRVEAFGPSILALTERACAGWGPDVDILAELSKLALAIVGRTLFDAEFSHQAASIARVLNQGRRLFRWGYLLFPVLEWLPFTDWFARRNRRQVDDALRPVLAEHYRRPRPDLLSMLIEAGLSPEEVRDEAVTLLLAGTETTANALAWTCWLLSEHPAVQDELAGSSPESPLLQRVLWESMRLYPPNWVISRVAREEVWLGPHRVGAGATCLVSQYVLHRNPRWFPEPERFLPSRWESGERPRFAYLPFGAGSRKCIGEHFAMLEATVVLSAILRRWRLEAWPGQRVGLDPGITLRPSPGPRVRLRAR